MDEHTVITNQRVEELSPQVSLGQTHKSVPYSMNQVDCKFGAWMLLLAFLAVKQFSLLRTPDSYGVGVPIYMLCYVVFLFAYAKVSGKKIQKEGFFWLGIIGIGGISYVWVYHMTLGAFLRIFLWLVLLYLPLASFGAQLEGETGSFFLLDGINMLVLIPFGNWKAHWKAISANTRWGNRLRSILSVLAGLVITFPLLFIVMLLLSQADKNFSGLIGTLLNWFGDSVFSQVGDFLLVVPTGAYLFSLIYGTMHQREIKKISPERVKQSCKRWGVVPKLSVYAVVTMFSLLYVIFVALQGSYYFDALRGVLPGGYTYANYARKGFFELVTISMINVGMILVTGLLCKKSENNQNSSSDHGMRWGNVVLSVLTLFLIATAMTKMLLYIKVYGLTPLRIIPSLFMVFLGLVFLLIIIVQFRPLPVMKISVYVFAVGCVLLSVCNVDGRIAEYNLGRYQQGTLEDYPENSLLEGSLASVPVMYQTWRNTERVDLKIQLQETVKKIQNHYKYRSEGERTLTSKNIAKDQAVWQMEKMLQ